MGIKHFQVVKLDRYYACPAIKQDKDGWLQENDYLQNYKP